MTTPSDPITPPVPPVVNPPIVVPSVVSTITPEVAVVTAKPFYTSKTFWLGVLLTIIGISTYFTDPAHNPTLTLASISEAVGGVGTIVLRLWFTNQPITQYALNALHK